VPWRTCAEHRANPRFGCSSPPLPAERRGVGPEGRAQRGGVCTPEKLGYVGYMRTAITWVIGLFVLLALPSAALGATPRWPSASDVRSATPGLGAKDASCIAGYYQGRLSGKAWLTPFYKLTPAQKLVTDAGFKQCMTLAQRTALIKRQGVLDWGQHSQLQCVAGRTAARSRSQLLSFTTLGREIRADDTLYRQCGLMGAIYASVARTTQLSLTKAEQTCANRLGSADPLRQRAKAPTMAQRKAIGAVFDRCVGRKSEQAMWLRLLHDYSPAKSIPCIAQHSLGITFATIFSDTAGLQDQAKRAVNACLVSGTT
jgi:hypothetical protein